MRDPLSRNSHQRRASGDLRSDKILIRGRIYLSHIIKKERQSEDKLTPRALCRHFKLGVSFVRKRRINSESKRIVLEKKKIQARKEKGGKWKRAMTNKAKIMLQKRREAYAAVAQGVSAIPRNDMRSGTGAWVSA